MSTAIAPVPGIPPALHRAETDLPFVYYQDGVTFQLLHADVEAGLWVVRVRFQPGVTLQRHKHTGEVFAFTISGSWKYLEYPEVNTGGSYLYEPAGSIHTYMCPIQIPGSPTLGLQCVEQTSTLTKKVTLKACLMQEHCWRSIPASAKKTATHSQT